MEQITITANITARDIENAGAQLVHIYNDARQNGGRPSSTIRAAVAALGYDLTAATVATWITGKTGDGRITRRNLDFAATVPGALTLDEIRASYIYAPSDIHPAHLDQLADALREYVPDDPTPAPQESEPTPEDRTATLISEITAAAAQIPGCKPEVKGAKTSKPVIWLHGITKEHKDTAKSIGAAWAAKKSAWWITPDRYTTRREIPAE